MRTAHQIHNPCPPTTTARPFLPVPPRRALSQAQPNKTVPRDVVVHLAQRASIVSAATLTADEKKSEGATMSDIEKWNGTNRLQTQVVDVSKDTVAIRSIDWDRDRFDIEFGLEKGTTYNSYVIYGDKTALVDASHEKFRGLYMKTLKQELESKGRTLDYIVVSHTEPDHSGLIPDILDVYPEAQVVGSKVALMYLKGLTHRPFDQKPVKGGDKVELGAGHTLEFVMAPNLHWPDTMFSFDQATGVMYTCDAFGAHYATDAPFDTELSSLSPHFRFYYDCLMRPNARSVLTALRKVKDLDYTTIATGHGPIIRYNLEELVGRYRNWSESVEKATAKVAVLYASDYGFSDRLSQTIARGITKANVAVEMLDLLSADPQELVEVVGRSSGVVLMAPPTESAEAAASVSTLLSTLKPKQKIIVAESYGGKDEPVDTLVASLVDINVSPIFDPLRVKETPDQAIYQAYEETGTDLAQALTQKESVAKKKAAMSGDIAKALARLSSGLYVVTADNKGARGAMIASWVAQASFEPLGLTVAVAKDRAIESLMQVGDPFVLNCLGDAKYAVIMKHFLQRFPPGADRFAGVDNFEANNGAPALSEAIAYIECRVKSRMETNDHWITYAEVTSGGLTDADAKTAVHRRKVANYY
ncbi:g9058 [Coccomyxa viridis]|uniref:G9058 protein n=1 Tax=Coccomyxa viridis TaxID=1274662 RepID=A0ABP1G4I9_9CHLO